MMTESDADLIRKEIYNYEITEKIADDV